MNRAVQYVKDLFFPPRCVFCDRVIAPYERPACPACVATEIPHIGLEICLHCGRETADCTCRMDTFLSDGIAAPFYYEDVVKKAIGVFKHAEDMDRTAYFATEMADAACHAFGDKIPDYITAVPMRPHDVAERGFNQAELLAKKLSTELHVPYVRLLQKILDTPSQKALLAEQRRCNLLGAFDVKSTVPLAGARILLVDDVVTTGSTTNECAKMLKIYGAAEVWVLAVALTRKKKEE